MDEYLFIALAKLKADRLKLERQQRLAARAELPPHEQPADSQRRLAQRPARGVWFSSGPQWREQS